MPAPLYLALGLLGLLLGRPGAARCEDPKDVCSEFNPSMALVFRATGTEGLFEGLGPGTLLCPSTEGLLAFLEAEGLSSVADAAKLAPRLPYFREVVATNVVRGTVDPGAVGSTYPSLAGGAVVVVAEGELQASGSAAPAAVSGERSLCGVKVLFTDGVLVPE